MQPFTYSFYYVWMPLCQCVSGFIFLPFCYACFAHLLIILCHVINAVVDCLPSECSFCIHCLGISQCTQYFIIFSLLILLFVKYSFTTVTSLTLTCIYEWTDWVIIMLCRDTDYLLLWVPIVANYVCSVCSPCKCCVWNLHTHALLHHPSALLSCIYSVLLLSTL